MTDQVNNEDLKDFACSVAVALFGPEAEAVFHPERPRKQRCCIYRSESSVGGVHDMVQVACGEPGLHWRKASGRWALFDARGVVHVCSAKDAFK
jgi:hypothetical protein